MDIDTNSDRFSSDGPGTETAGGNMASAGNAAEAIPHAVTQMVDQAIQSLQPKIHEAVNKLAERAMNMSNQAARDVATKVRSNPWYMVGGVVLLVVGLGLVFGLEERRDRRYPQDLH